MRAVSFRVYQNRSKYKENIPTSEEKAPKRGENRPLNEIQITLNINLNFNL